MICPVGKDWDNLVKKVGRTEAMKLFLANDYEVPIVVNEDIEENSVNEEPVKNSEKNSTAVNRLFADFSIDRKNLINHDNDKLSKTISDLIIAINTNGEIDKDAIELILNISGDTKSYDVLKKNLKEFSQYDETKSDEQNLINLFTNIIEGNILDSSDTRSKQISNTWNGLIKSVTDKVLGLTKPTVKLFSDAFPDNKILKSLSTVRVDKELQDSIEQELLKTHNQLELTDSNDEHYYTYNGNHIVKKSVTDRTSKKSDNTRSEKAEFAKNIGITTHDLMKNLVSKLLSGKSDINIDEYISELGTTSVNTLINYMNTFKLQFAEGTKFIPELRVYDKIRDEAGSVDLVAILPDGTMEIFDWKFQMFSKEEQDRGTPSFYKEKNWNIQLQAYRELISKQVKDAKFGKTRVIPIKIKSKMHITNGVVTKYNFLGFEVGGYSKQGGKIVTTGSDYLDAVPVDDEPIESEELNNLVNKLGQMREKVISDKETTKEGNQIRNDKIRTISKAIQKIRTKRDLSHFVEYAFTELKSIENKLESKSSRELRDELINDNNTIDFLINSENILFDTGAIIDEETRAKILAIRTRAKAASIKIEPLIKDIAVSIATDNGLGSNIFVAKEMTSLQKLFQGLSQSENKIIQSFYRLTRDSKEKTRNQIDDLVKVIDEKKKALGVWASRNGLTGLDMYKKLLQRDDEGNPTGRLLSKTSSKWKDAKAARIEAKDAQWIYNNTTFNTEGFEEYKKRSIERINNSFYSADEKKDKIIKGQKIAEIDIDYNVNYPNKTSNNAKALLNKQNWFIQANDSWDSEQWVDLNRSENKELLEFYDFFTNTMKELSEDLPVDMRKNAIPSIEKDLVEAIFEGNVSGSMIENMKYSIGDSISYNSRMDENHIDENGNPKKTIPLYYTDQLGSNKEDAQRKSYDLSRVLAMYGKMAYNYSNMSKIEGSTRILRRAMENQKMINTTTGNRAVINKITSKVAGNVAKAEDLEIFDDYINYELYGIKVKEKENTFSRTVKVPKKDQNGDVVEDQHGNPVYEEVEKEYSINRILKKTMRYFSDYSLAWNTVSASANFVGGMGNTFIFAMKGKFFTKGQLLNSIGKVATRDKKYVTALQHFDMMQEHFLDDRIKNLSASTAIKLNKSNYMYALQHQGDKAIHELVASSMMQNYTIIDGKLQTKKPADKSIIEQLDSSTIEEILPKNSKAYNEFRAKTQALTERIMGMSSRNDINRVKMTLLGQTMMHFRSWIPRTVQERLGGLQYNYDLETWEKGRMSSTFELLMNRNFLGNMQDFIIGTKTNATATAKELYQKALRKDPTLEITENDFVDLHLQNLAAMRSEIYLSMAFVLTFVNAAQPDEDDNPEERRIKALFLVHFSRMHDELSFYINPSSTMEILKSPIPLSGFFIRLGDVVGDIANVPVSVFDPNMTFGEASSKLAKDLMKIIPLSSQSFKWIEED